jgi:AcrR family transcriptional regulator
MGNREDLLAGARRVILQQGAAQSTARDIAAESGVSLAAIGYHFGSKDALVTAALLEALGTGIGDDMEQLVRAGEGRSLLEGFAQMWNRMPEVFAANREALTASLENTLRVMRDPGAARQMGTAVAEAHEGLAEVLSSVHPELGEERARAIALLNFALVQGLSLLWLVSPAGEIVSGDELAAAVAALAGVEPTASSQ